MEEKACFKNRQQIFLTVCHRLIGTSNCLGNKQINTGPSLQTMNYCLLCLWWPLWAITSEPLQAEKQSGTFLSNVNLLPISFNPPYCFHLRLPLFVFLVVLQPWLPQRACTSDRNAGCLSCRWPGGQPASLGSTSFATLCHAAGIPACPLPAAPHSSADVRFWGTQHLPGLYHKLLALPLKTYVFQ